MGNEYDAVKKEKEKSKQRKAGKKHGGNLLTLRRVKKIKERKKGKKLKIFIYGAVEKQVLFYSKFQLCIPSCSPKKIKK